jgi:hypothetical protein
MRQPVGDPNELVGPECAPFVSDLLGARLDQRKIVATDLPRSRARGLRDEDDFRTQGTHHASAFLAVTLGHHGDEVVTANRAHDREACSRIPAREFYHGLAGPQLARGKRVVDDLTGDAVLLREARGQVVKLRDDPTTQPARQSREFDGRRVSDDLHDRWSDAACTPIGGGHAIGLCMLAPTMVVPSDIGIWTSSISRDP